MAKSQSASGNRAQLWAKEVFQDVMDNLYFNQIGQLSDGSVKDDNNIVYVRKDLMKDKGDRITFPLTAKLSGDGVAGDSELEGNEERVLAYSEAVLIDQIRQGVRIEGLLDEQKNAYNMRSDAKQKLSTWLQEFVERQIFLKLGGVNNTSLTDINGNTVGTRSTWSNTPDTIPAADTAGGSGNRYLCADFTNGADSLATTDLITPALISRLRTMAYQASPKIRPLKIKGRNYYVLFVHPRQAYDLRQNAVWAQAMREAELRGKDNPIFTESMGVWNQVIVIEHEYVPFLDISVAGNNFAASGSGTDFAAVDAYRAILCGRQAAGWAIAEYKPGTWSEKTFDYDNQTGFAVKMIGGIQKLVFNSLEYGCIALDTAATAV